MRNLPPNMTNQELERYLYITNDPQVKLAQTLVDLETDRDELYWVNEKLKKEITDWDDWK